MTKDTIISTLTAIATETLPEIAGDTELTGTQCMTITDALAGGLETVNPNHDYPPTPR